MVKFLVEDVLLHEILDDKGRLRASREDLCKARRFVAGEINAAH